jgi:hypothetical protein
VLATKPEAFAGRGRGDYLGSPDLEDISRFRASLDESRWGSLAEVRSRQGVRPSMAKVHARFGPPGTPDSNLNLRNCRSGFEDDRLGPRTRSGIVVTSQHSQPVIRFDGFVGLPKTAVAHYLRCLGLV